MLRALIFDFDGLILDTESALIEAYGDVHAAHGLDEQTLFDIARLYRRAVIAACLPAAARVKREPALDFRPVRMAFEAVLLKHGQHLLFEERGVLRTKVRHGWEPSRDHHRAANRTHRSHRTACRRHESH